MVFHPPVHNRLAAAIGRQKVNDSRPSRDHSGDVLRGARLLARGSAPAALRLQVPRGEYGKGGGRGHKVKGGKGREGKGGTIHHA